MTSGDQYRGTRLYALVLVELVAAAQYRGVTTYQHIAAIMGLPSSGQHMARQIGLVLGEISEDEVGHGRPMLSAVAVGASGEPGPGFYTAAKDLGRALTDAARLPEPRVASDFVGEVVEDVARLHGHADEDRVKVVLTHHRAGLAAGGAGPDAPSQRGPLRRLPCAPGAWRCWSR